MLPRDTILKALPNVVAQADPKQGISLFEQPAEILFRLAH